jgi:MFS family permease
MRHRLVVGFTAAAAIGMAAWCLLPDTVIARNTDLDEGVYLMVARLLHRGYKTDAFFFDQFWLFPKIIAAAFGLFGDSLIVARVVVFAFSFLGLLGAAVIAYQLGGGWVAMMASILIGAIGPLYIRGSRMALADVPAASCIVWALVFTFLFQKASRRIWLILGGLCTGMALVLKPFAIGFVVTIVILLFYQRSRRENSAWKIDRAILVDLVIFGTAAVLTVWPFVDFLHPIQEYQRVIGFHWAERNWLIKRVDDRWRGLLGFTKLNLPVILFAIAGLISLRPLPISIMALLIGELITTAILLDMPPWIHHYILILPLLVVFCVVGFSPGLTRFTHLISDFRDGRRPAFENKWGPIFFAGAILVSVIDLPWLIKYDHRERFPESLRVEPVVRYTEQTFSPNACFISDDALIPYLADRLIPPPAINFVFGDVMKFDRPSLQRFEQIAQDNHVAGIITTTRYPRNPQLMSWIEENFPISREIGTHHPDELTARIYSTDKQQR